MFEDYKIEKVLTFDKKIERICISEGGVFMAQTRRALTVSHLRGCQEEIEMYTYFKKELNFDYKNCNGMAELSNFSDQQNVCCFVIIMDFDLWCIIIRVVKGKQLVQINVEQLKMLSVNMQQQNAVLRFVERERKDLLVLTEQVNQSNMNLVIIIPEKKHIDKFTITRMRNLELKKENQEQAGEQFELLYRKNLIFSICRQYVLLYNQLPIEIDNQHNLFFYSFRTANNQVEKNYPQHILGLPIFQQPRLLSHLEMVPLQEEQTIQKSIILALYQLPLGLEIIEATFQNPRTVMKKFWYENLRFSQFICSSLTPKLIALKGIEYCLQNHSILIRSSSGVSLENQLTLISLSSTTSPKIVNRVSIGSYFNCLASTSKGFWLSTPSCLFQAHRISKMHIYRFMLNFLGQGQKSSLGYVQRQLQLLLE